MKIDVRKFTNAYGSLSMEAENQAEKYQLEALRIALTKAGLHVTEFNDYPNQITLRIQPTES